MSDRSFVRFGGIAGVLLAASAWSAVVEYYVLVPTAQQQPAADQAAYLTSLAQTSTGTELFLWLLALTALWALIGTVAFYFRIRPVGEAWAFFATLVGAIAAAASIVADVFQLAQLRYLASLTGARAGLAGDLFTAPSAANPLNVWTTGLTAIWFLVTALLMLRADFPRLLAVLGLVAFADLSVGFFATALGAQSLAVLAILIAGAVGGPIFWLWLGLLLFRER